MRASHALALAALATAAACSHDATSLLVTVVFDDARYMPATLDVAVTADAQPLRATTVGATGRSIHSGDSFAVLLPDAVAGETIDVEVSLAPAVSGHASTVAVKDDVVPLTVTLGGATGVDGGIDMTAVDATLSDGSCTPQCSGGMAILCTDLGLQNAACAFGCAGDTCAQPTSCAGAGDVSAGGSFAGTSVGYPNTTSGSCGGTSGPDLVTTFAQSSWRSVTVDGTGTAYDAALYLRTQCASPSSEPPAAGPCTGAAPSGTMCSSTNPVHLVACGLPPGRYWTWLGSQSSTGGAWQLDYAFAPVDLNSCAGAGNLLDGGTFPATTTGHANHFSTTAPGCGDKGASEPDATFFFTLTSTRNVTLSTAGTTFSNIVYVRPSCGANDLGCAPSTGPSNTATLMLNALAPGTYYVIVDGNKNGSGDLQIALTLQ